MSINTENWDLFNEIHREIDPPVEIVDERPAPRNAKHHFVWERQRRLNLSSYRIPQGKERSRDKEAIQRALRNTPRDGELRLKDFLRVKMREQNINYGRAWVNFSNGQYPVTVRRVNSRVLFVRLRGEVGEK